MEKMKFKTNINCSGCVSKVTPFLDKQEGIENWEVNTENPDKILTVESNSASKKEVIETLGKIGFKAQPIEGN
ncbi:heavy-metal-associated domain-containing protein [Muricauda sp. SCSIO 64092]|uniref:heavy-metal-associated domain-containing protein n=1 Tax=Allomuricauda sp. SCSIO 64092 TaxID=2908842 RepID=UPI001FF5172A|nr:heavy-metal-associated domain-containing protein [Muricauda sp. SCSIO 64092]UOY06782.1 heavy-metal-associated domain-containing protein [Muricauda sp. SCSIO 64092]